MGSEGSVALRVADGELRPKDFGAGLDEMVARRPSALAVAQNALMDAPMLHFWWYYASALSIGRPKSPARPSRPKIHNLIMSY